MFFFVEWFEGSLCVTMSELLVWFGPWVLRIGLDGPGLDGPRLDWPGFNWLGSNGLGFDE